jgi:hypothetical protein
MMLSAPVLGHVLSIFDIYMLSHLGFCSFTIFAHKIDERTVLSTLTGEDAR